MGCSSSKPEKRPTTGTKSSKKLSTDVITTAPPALAPAPPVQSPIAAAPSDKLAPLSENEILMRIEAPSQTQTLVHSGIKMYYAWVSQRGFYPEALDKENQDTFSILPKLSNQSDQALFGVFDGHGKEGHFCARYARDKLSQFLIQRIEGIPSTNVRAMKKAIIQAHTMANEKLHGDPSIDDSLSGTTAISVLMRGRTMYINNVGDSRAIMVSILEDGSAFPQPLSSDQTPYRKDERERVKACGARILTMDQIEGVTAIHEDFGDFSDCDGIDESGDPPRIWSPEGDYPGTAFTRSIGDMIAEELGVVAEPEILVREIQPTDKYLIIASDGVYEFMTNQQVADIVASCKTALDACHALVSAAYGLWLRYEVRTDDITAIVLHLDQPPPPPSETTTAEGGAAKDDSSSMRKSVSRNQLCMSLVKPQVAVVDDSAAADANDPTGESPLGLTVTPADIILMESRPVRTTVSRAKRKNMILTAKDADDELAIVDPEVDFTDLIVSKSEEETAAIAQAVKLNFLFQHLSSQQRKNIVSVMKTVEVKEGDWVITQGDVGDNFYLVNTGRYEVRVKAPSGHYDHKGGNVVHMYDSTNDQHPGFGELALMYNRPRAASVIALTDGRLWALDANVFKHIVMRSINVRKRVLGTVRTMELLKALSLQQRQQVVDLMQEVGFKAGAELVHQGERCDNFYVIVEGECECSITSETEVEQLDEATGERSKRKVTNTTVTTMKPHEFFCQHVLLSANAVSRRTIVAITDMKLLFVSRQTFEEYLGVLSTIIEGHHKRAAAAAAARTQEAPKSFSEINVRGLITADNSGPILLGSFASPVVNVVVRSFLMKEVDKLRISSTVLNLIEGAKTVSLSAGLLTKNASSQSLGHLSARSVGGAHFRHSVIVPELLTVCRDSNALHVVFNTAVVADMASLLKANNPNHTLATDPDTVVYIAACVLSGLEYLHDMGILYRGIQPESLYVDTQGRVVFTDFRLCKVGIPRGRTFTICGCRDYMAPEMISRQGHSLPVDLWSMGVLLYELSTGKNPFTGGTDAATHARISSFGTTAFPELTFPDEIPAGMRLLIEKLLVPTPQFRLGATTSRGFPMMKQMMLFEGIDFATFHTSPPTSPLLSMAIAECDSMLTEGVDPAILAAFSEEYSGDGWEIPALE